MKRFLVFGVLLLLLCGCGSGSFQVPKQDYQSQVQVLGVAPLLLDRSPPLDYPEKEALYDLVARSNRGKHHQLVKQLKQKRGYFDVRALSSDPESLAQSLLTGPQPPDRFGRPQGYLFDRQLVAELARRNVVDALLVVVFTPARVEETRRSRNLLESLTTDYYDILATATVVDRNGQVLWQLAGQDAFQAVTLQYADFDEAYYNRTDQVRIKNISLAGIAPAFEAAEGSEELPSLYQELFKRIVAGISPGLLDAL